VFNEPKPGSRLFVSDTLVTVLFEIPAFKAPVNSFVYICFGTEVKKCPAVFAGRIIKRTFSKIW
jgi:hypothetical protein